MTLIGYSGPPSQSIDFNENSSNFQRKKDGGSAWYKSLPKRELPPRDRRLQSSSFQVFMKTRRRRRSNKRPLSFQIKMFFFFFRMKELVTSVEQILPQIEVS